MDHAQIKELIPLKALSRLEGDEARAVDEHLAAGCDECERELASFSEALAGIAIVEDSGAEVSSQRIWSAAASPSRPPDDPRRSDRAARRVEDRAVRQPSRRSGFAMLRFGGRGSGRRDRSQRGLLQFADANHYYRHFG